MSFKTLNFGSPFNSAISQKFIDFYESALKDEIQTSIMRERSRAFAPSALRCDRKSWFRLRGTKPDYVAIPDVGMQYRAEVGTARHLSIQRVLKHGLGDDWIDVADFLEKYPIPYEYSLISGEYESKISIVNPPIRFACDGIIRFNGKIYLLEIKTSEHDTWVELSGIKPMHLDQIKGYSTILGIHDVMFVYEDRLSGEWKCYESYITDSDMTYIKDKFERILELAKSNVAPDRVNYGDIMCSNCEYKNKCKDWG